MADARSTAPTTNVASTTPPPLEDGRPIAVAHSVGADPSGKPPSGAFAKSVGPFPDLNFGVRL